MVIKPLLESVPDVNFRLQIACYNFCFVNYKHFVWQGAFLAFLYNYMHDDLFAGDVALSFNNTFLLCRGITLLQFFEQL